MLLLWFALYNNTHIRFSRTCSYNTNKCWDQTQIGILIHLTPCYSSTALIRSTIVFVMFFKLSEKLSFVWRFWNTCVHFFPTKSVLTKKRTDCSKHRTCMYCTCHQVYCTQSKRFLTRLSLFPFNLFYNCLWKSYICANNQKHPSCNN